MISLVYPASVCFKCRIHVTEFIVPKIDSGFKGFGTMVEEM